MKNILCPITLLIASFMSSGQTTIYSETFTGQEGQGAIGTTNQSPIVDLNEVNWNIDISNASLTNANDYFRVITVGGNELLEGRDLDTEAIWFSPIIDITNYFDIAFSLEVTESNGTGGNNLETNDNVIIDYRIDSGPWLQAETNGLLSDDYDLTLTSQSLLNGNTLEIRVTMINNGGGERMRIDNIDVNGFESCTVFALPFNEDFEGVNFPPTCWNSFRGLNDLGTENDWTTSTLVANSGTNSAFVEFEVVAGGTAQDWLVTPAIDLSTDQSQLRFFTREQFTIDYNTEYTIRISQTSATDISSFTIIRTYNETELGSTFNEKTIDLSAYSGVVYIAFVMEQNDGDNWFLDDVSVIDISGCSSPVDVTNLNANSSGGLINLNWDLSTCYDEILIVGKEDSPVTAFPTGDGTAILANPSFGEGTEIVLDEFVVFKGTDSSVSLSNVTFGNTYHFRSFTRKGEQWSEGIDLSLDLDYCEVSGDISFDTAITLVNFGSINNVSGQGSGYDDFTAQSTTVRQGNTENLIVNLNTDGNFAVYSYAWIDWNQDGDFEDANETYDLGDTINNPDGPTANSPLSIAIPNDAIIGDTRLRILCQYYFGTPPLNGPCDGSTDGEIEDYTITVEPAVSYVYDDGWAPSDPNGIATLANPMNVVRGNAVLSSDTQFKSIVVNPGASLTIETGTTIETAEGLRLESSSLTYSSLLLDGTINGTVSYSRHVSTASAVDQNLGTNDLVSPPLHGSTFGDLVNANSNILSGTTNGIPAYLFGPFDSATSNYIIYTSDNFTDPLTAGLGYRTGSTDNGNYLFTGSVESGTIDVPVINGGTSDWNLIGNPYPSYISARDVLVESENTTRFDESAIGIYGYDGSASDGWTIYNLANTTSSTLIAPGQGFFIKAGESGTIRFTTAMRRTGTSDDFILGRNSEPLTFLKLKLSSDDLSYNTEFYFNSESSLALDPGYDAEVYGSIPQAFALYSLAPDTNLDVPLSIQSLNLEALLDTTVPLGVNTSGNSLINFEIIENQLPTGTQVYLLDLETGISTPLHTNGYEVQISEALSGIGRFYLKFQNASLDVNASSLTDVSIRYMKSSNLIEILGQIEEDTQCRVFDISGKCVVTRSLISGSSRNTIQANSFEDGVYIVNLLSKTGTVTQKIMVSR